MKLKFIKNERAVLIKNFLVIADLHIGYEKVLEDRGYKIPSQVNNFIKRIKKLKKKTKAKNLIILGDIKHNIPIDIEEKYEVPNFFREIVKIFDEIIVIKGNHDGNLESLVHESNVKIITEFIFKDISFIHGHRWPSEKAMQSKLIVMAHVHPIFKIKDKLKIIHNYPSWIIGSLNKKKLEKYKKIESEKVLVVPCFNPLFSGYEHFAGPLSKALKKEEVILLDLTKVK